MRSTNSSYPNTTGYQYPREFSLTEGSAPGTRGCLEAGCRYQRRFVAGDRWLMVATSVSRAEWQSLLTDRAIDRFAEEVCVAGVAGSLLDEVQQHPPEREVPPVTQRPDR